MNRIIVIVLVAVSCFGCKKGSGNSDFKGILRELCSESSGENSGDLYSSGTIRSLKRAVKAGIVGKPGALIRNYFSPGTNLKIIKSSIKGSDAVVRVRYLDHPVENVIGSEVDYRFIYQERRWKLDFKKEVDDIIRSSQSGESRNYIENKASSY